MVFRSVFEALGKVGTGVYNLFFSSDPDYQPELARPWHEAARDPEFWLATLQMRFDELAGCKSGNGFGGLQDVCDDLVGLVGPNTVAPSAFLYETKRFREEMPSEFVEKLAQKLDQALLQSLRQDQYFSAQCLQSELATLIEGDETLKLKEILSLYCQVVHAPLFKAVLSSVQHWALESNQRLLDFFHATANFNAGVKAMQSYSRCIESLQHKDNLGVAEELSFYNLKQAGIDLVSKSYRAIVERPFTVFGALLLAQARYAFGSGYNGNFTTVGIGGDGEVTPNYPLQVTYGVPDMVVYADPLSQGHTTNISMDAFYIPGNAGLDLRLVGGGALPSWITFEPAPPKFLGRGILGEECSQFGLDIKADGNIVYVAGGDAGLFLFEISNRSHPQLISNLSAPSQYDVREISLQNNLLYLANGKNGFAIVNASEPGMPTLVSALQYPGETTSGLFLDGDVAFLIAKDFMIFNVSNPLSPKLISQTFQGNQTWVKVEGRHAYLVDAVFGSISTYDVSDLRNPQFLSKYIFPNGNLTGVDLQDSVLYVSTKHDGLQIVSASDPSRLGFLGEFIGNRTFSPAVASVKSVPGEEKAYVMIEEGGLFSLNLTDKSFITDHGGFALTYNVPSFVLYQDLIITSDATHCGIELLKNDFTLASIRTWPVPNQRTRVNLDLALSLKMNDTIASSVFKLKVEDNKPVFRSSLPGLNASIPVNMSFGITVYDFDNDPISVSVTCLKSQLNARFEVKDNFGVELGGYIQDAETAYGLAVQHAGDFSHAAFGAGGLVLLDTRDFSRIVATSVFRPPAVDIRKAVLHADNIVLASDVDKGLYCLKHNSSNAYELLSSIEIDASGGVVSVSEKAYVVSEKHGFYAISLKDPRLPGITRHNQTISGRDLAVLGDIIYVAGDKNVALWVVNATDPSNSAANAIPLQDGSLSNAIALTQDLLVTVGDTIQVYSLRAPINPVPLNSHQLQSVASTVTLMHDAIGDKLLACISIGQRGLEVIDISDPAKGISTYYLYNSQENNFNVMQTHFMPNNIAYIAAGRMGLQIVKATYGWYFSHYVMAHFKSGDQGFHQVNIHASSPLSTTTQSIQLQVLNSKPQLTGDFSSTINVPYNKDFNQSLDEWFYDPDGDPIKYTLTLTDGVQAEDMEAVIKLNSKGVLVCAPGYADVGQYDFTLYAYDPYNKFLRVSLVIDITATRWQKFVNWLIKQIEGQILIAVLACAGIGLTVYRVSKNHTSQSIRKLIKTCVDDLASFRCAMMNMDHSVAQNSVDQITAYLEKFHKDPLCNSKDYEENLKQFSWLCLSFIVKQRKAASNKTHADSDRVSLWPIFEQSLIMEKLQEMLDFLMKNNFYGASSTLASRLLLDLVRFSALSIYATEQENKVQEINMEKRNSLVSSLLELHSLSAPNSDDQPCVEAVKTWYNVQMALDWARCLPMESTWAFTKSLATLVVSVKLGDVFQLFVTIQSHSPRQAFMPSARLMLKAFCADVNSVVSFKNKLLMNETDAYGLGECSGNLSPVRKMIVQFRIKLGVCCYGCTNRLVATGRSTQGEWAFHIAAMDKMWSVHTGKPTDGSAQKLREELLKIISRRQVFYDRQVCFSRRMAKGLKKDPRNGYVKSYANDLLSRLDQAMPSASAGQAAGAGQSAGGPAQLNLARQQSDPLLAAMLPNAAAVPAEGQGQSTPITRAVNGSRWQSLRSCLCCRKPSPAVASRSVSLGRIPSPPTAKLQSGGYVLLADLESEQSRTVDSASP